MALCDHSWVVCTQSIRDIAVDKIAQLVLLPDSQLEAILAKSWGVVWGTHFRNTEELFTASYISIFSDKVVEL